MTTPRRDPDAVRRAFTEYAGSGDERLRNELVEEHLGLAHQLARRFTNRGEPYDDLVQVASMALVKSVDRFEPDRGVEFSTFATRTIIGELKRHFRDKGWAIHVPRDLQERALLVSRHSEKLAGRLGRSPTLRELAAEMECPIDEVIEATQALRSYDTASLDAPVGAEDQESVSLGEMLPSHDDGYDLVHAREIMAERWHSLSELERRVVKLRLVEDLTQREIGRRIGYSQMHVSRVLRRSLERLKVNAA